MKTAIIGAGLSGLSCAIGLERHGIKPVIFEKRAHVGEAIDYSIIWPRIINRPIVDPLKYLKKEYSIEITPLNRMKRITMFSPDHKAVERGSLGYIFRRGFSGIALEKQLLNYLNSPIIFNKYIEAEDIKNEFDYVVVANASNFTAKNLGVWTETFNSHARVAHVMGKFKPNEVIMWLDTVYSKNGFCYLIPISDKEASLVQIVNGINSHELDYYWKQFLFKENINYSISITTDTEHDCGFAQPVQVGNILLTGNAAGFTDDLIGCGGLNAIESGMLAAYAIVYGKDYNTLTRPIFEDIVKLHELRKTVNTLDNEEKDHLLTVLNLPVIKYAIYNNPFFKISSASKWAKLYNSFIKKQKRSITE